MAVKQKLNLIQKVTTLIRSGEKNELADFLNDLYPQDLAPIIENLKDKEKILSFKALELSNAAKIFSEFNSETQKAMLELLGAESVAQIISEMDVDDATDLIIRLPEEEKAKLLKVLPDPVQQAHVQELINYPPESAGGIMSTDLLKLRSDMTVHIAFNCVRRQAAEYKSQIYYLYVVDNENKLVGVISLRNLICAPLNDLVANHMNTEVITCKVTDDQETVAKTISKYDLIAIPIIDDQNSLKGIVTIDDVVDILSKETTEDIYQGSGISDAFPSYEIIFGRVSSAVRARLPWLLITLFGQACAAAIIASFDKTIISAPMAVSFMPLLSGLSGNIGGQTATIIVRGLVTGDVELRNSLKFIIHELKIGFTIGMICAVITGIIAWHQHALPSLGFIVAFSLCCSMTLGVLLGTIFPILLQYFKKDPATASAPFITTILDILNFTFYLSIISLTLKHVR